MEKKKKTPSRRPAGQQAPQIVPPGISPAPGTDRHANSRSQETRSSSPGTTPWKIPPRLAVVLVLIAGLTTSALIHFSHLTTWNRHGNLYFYDDHLPLMTTLDAYYYLRLAADLSNEQYARKDELRPECNRPDPVPLLVSLTAWLHRTTGTAIDRIAFYLPPLLGSLMVFPYLLWGRRLGNLLAALVASLAGASSYYWYTRTCLGRFDTDCLNPFFVLLIGYCVLLFVTEKKPLRFIWLPASFLLAILFGLWWPQTKLLGFALLVSAYSLSFFLPSARAEKLLKIGLLSAGILLALAGLLGFSSAFPSPIRHAMDGGMALLRLIAKETASVFPNVGQSISELEAPSVLEIAVKVGGHAVPFALSMAGLALMAFRRPDLAVFLAPGLVLGLCSLMSRRFLIFLIPYYALGIGYLLGDVLWHSRILAKLPGYALRTAATCLLAGVLLAPSFMDSMEKHRLPQVTANEVLLARSAAKDASPEALIWAWWDYGYFLQYITGKRTFIDGGMQSPERTFLTAFPLSCKDPILAGNWIRFFAAHDLKGLKRLQKQFGTKDKALTFLQKVLASPDLAEVTLRQHGIKNISGWTEYLFPDADVRIFLSQDFMGKAYWWYYFGTWQLDHKEGTHADAVKISGIDPQVVEKQASITMGGRSLKIDRVAYVDGSGATIKKLGRPTSATPGSPLHTSGDTERGGKLAVFIKGTPNGYVLDGNVFDSLTGTLLLNKPLATPGFSTLIFHPMFGGAWQLENGE